VAPGPIFSKKPKLSHFKCPNLPVRNYRYFPPNPKTVSFDYPRQGARKFASAHLSVQFSHPGLSFLDQGLRVAPGGLAWTTSTTWVNISTGSHRSPRAVPPGAPFCLEKRVSGGKNKRDEGNIFGGALTGIRNKMRQNRGEYDIFGKIPVFPPSKPPGPLGLLKMIQFGDFLKSW